ncbi:MAG TPA: aa3-type cytochrome c oxidase subunit IV [Caulobacteraceae bacterium]|jgi:thiamine transporter ThiT
MSDAVHEYHSGDQDITEQVATFSVFGRLMKWCSLAVAVLVIALVLWFCVGAGFWTGLITGVVLLAVGIFALRSRSGQGH